MDLEQFDAIVHETIDALPAWVHDALEDIGILMVDEPDAAFHRVVRRIEP